MVGPYLIISLALGHADYPINPALGVPGYPDCVQTNPGFNMVDTRVNEATLSCAQVSTSSFISKIAKNRQKSPPSRFARNLPPLPLFPHLPPETRRSLFACVARSELFFSSR